MNFLHNLNRWLRSTSGQLSAADWTSNINRMQVSHSVDDEASDRGVVLQRIWHLILLESVGGMRKKGGVGRWVGGWVDLCGWHQGFDTVVGHLEISFFFSRIFFLD